MKYGKGHSMIRELESVVKRLLSLRSFDVCLLNKVDLSITVRNVFFFFAS